MIGSSDQLALDYVIGKTIIGGSQFADALGRFFPVTINNTGITINSGGNSTSASAIVFHNTAVVGTDELITLGVNALGILPNSASSVNNTFVVADRVGANYLGWQMEPAFNNAGVIQPRLDVISPLGAVNTIWNHGANFIQIGGAVSGSSPVIDLLGPDANISLFIRPKGTGAINIGSSAGNYVQIPALGAGTAQVQITAVGADANVTIFLIPKGGGVVALGAQYANYWSANGAPAAATPNLGVLGSDANISLALSPKGTGVVFFNYAGTALGGGAAPTLGTIGGAGPAVAAQNEWMKVIVNGNVRFIPLWA